MDDEPNTGGPWYHRWWGVVGITVVIAVALLALFVSALSGYYWWQIRQGHGSTLAEQFSQQFTLVGGASAKKILVDRAALEIPTAPATGAGKPAVTIVEWLDFKCPNCRTAAPIMDQVLQKFGRRVRLIARNFPAESIHPGATDLANLAWCAGQQGRFWPLYDALYQQQDSLPVPLTDEAVAALAQATALDAPQLQTCRASAAAAQAVRADYFDALRFGVRGTPTFFINGIKVEGVIPLDAWTRLLTPGS